MRLQDRAQLCARLGVLTNKAGADLDSLLSKWFSKHFVKGLKLPLLKSMKGTEALASFEAGLSGCSEDEVIGVVRKLDPHRPEVLRRPRPELIAHLRALAEGRAEPAPKPKAPRPAAKKAIPKKTAKGGILSQSRQ